MKRRNFIRYAAMVAHGVVIMHDLFARPQEKIYGYNNMKYGLDLKWSKADIFKHPVNDCQIFVHPHDVCIDRDENIYLAQWSSGKVYPDKLTRV